MSRAIVTLATGAHQTLLDIALPSFQQFADRHGYDMVVNPELDCYRPPSWWKIPILRACLDEYDEVLWLDADVVVVDGSEDLEVPADAWQGLVQHRTADGDVPNCGVWFVREPMRQVLDKMWAQTHRVSHGWWEQAALMDLLGYVVDPRPAVLAQPSGLYKRTHWLDHGFNVHLWDTPGPTHPRFMHATMHTDRVKVMQEWAAGNVAPVPDIECRHMYRVAQCPFCPR